MHANKIIISNVEFYPEKIFNNVCDGVNFWQIFECGIFISRRFYWRGAVYLMNYAIYTVDNIWWGDLSSEVSIFQIQQVGSNADLKDIMNSDAGFDVLEKIGYPGASTTGCTMNCSIFATQSLTIWCFLLAIYFFLTL